ncbi:P-loop containing nucleoside triphosphate hydrolase protein [Tuber indicum]|nr:P-loop containing nucleoside triphosphate hydrolase protein [Tuber indicum]
MPEYRVCLKSGMGKKSKGQVRTAIATQKRSPSTPPPKTAVSGIDEPQYEVAVKFVDLQGDHNSPCCSVKRFEDLGLSKDLIEGIYFMNFKKPSNIQERALPLLLSNPPRNMIGQSQSGTGKTAALALTMLTRIDMAVSNVQALCLAPTRELARQIQRVVQTMGQFTNVKTQFAIPNMVRPGQMIDAHIVFGTPGTVLDLIQRKQLPVEHLKVFTLDEVDSMLDLQGLGEQCLRVKRLDPTLYGLYPLVVDEALISSVSRNIPSTTQIALFSATSSDQVFKYMYRFAPNANLITLKSTEPSLAGFKQLCMDCRSEEDKYRVLLELYHVLTVGSSIIFAKKRETASEIQRRMEEDGHKVSTLHSAQQGIEREKAVHAFRSGKSKVLITTDALARGIDVETVSMVVSYDLPLDKNRLPDPVAYLHRVGRTGTFGRPGVSVYFAHDKQSLYQVSELSSHFGTCMTRVSTDDIDEVEIMVNNVLKNKKGVEEIVVEAG